jgi:hypothetical protein
MATASDDFNRANNADLGANWTPTVGGDDTWTISGNQAVVSDDTSDCSEYYSAVAFGANQFSQCTIVAVGDDVGVGPGPAVRVGSASKSYYSITCGSIGTQLRKAVAGTITEIDTDGTVWVNGDVARLEINGSTITVKRNGVEIAALTNTDGDLTTGQPGIFYSSVAAVPGAIDDWSGGDLVEGTLGYRCIDELGTRRPAPFRPGLAR